MAAAAEAGIDAKKAASAALFWNKMMYCVIYAGWSCMVPFHSVLFNLKGMTPSQIGMLQAIPPLVSIVASPSVAALADWTGRRRLVIGGFLAVGVLVKTLLALDTGFWGIGLILLVSEFCTRPVPQMVDAATLHTINEFGHGEYGLVRMWGAVGWGLLAPIAGSAADMWGPAMFFILHGIITTPASLVACKLRTSATPATGKSWSTLFKVLGSTQLQLLLLMVFCMGCCFGAIGQLLPLFLTEHLGGSDAVVGWSLFFTCVAEVPFFAISGTLIRKFGEGPMLMAALIAFAIRVICYSELINPWWVLPVELLHGVTFGAGWAACTSLGNSVAPPGLGTTTQGLIASVHWGWGGAIGGAVGGALYEHVGPRAMYRLALIPIAVGTLSYLALLRLQWLDRKAKARQAATDHATDSDDLEGDPGDIEVDPERASAVAATAASLGAGNADGLELAPMEALDKPELCRHRSHEAEAPSAAMLASNPLVSGGGRSGGAEQDAEAAPLVAEG